MAHRDDEAGAEKDVGFAVDDGAAVQGSRVHHHEQGVAILFQLGTLVRPLRILDGQFVQAKRRLQRLHGDAVGTGQAYPHETIGVAEEVAHLVDVEMGDLPAIAIRFAVDDGGVGTQVHG